MIEINLDLLEYIRAIFVNNMIQPLTFIEFLIPLIILFIIRGYLLFKIEYDAKFSKEKQSKKNIYILTHVGFELFIAYMVSYGIAILTGGNPKHVAINLIGAPFFGFMIALLFDMKVIMELENEMKIGIPNELKKKKSDGDNKSKLSNGDHNITINVGSPHVENNKPAIFSGNANELYLDKEELTDENFKEKIADTLNNVINIQDQQADIIAKNINIINDIRTVIGILKETELNDKKLELKSMIYQCLNNGFALPKENDIITTKYNSYRALGGNHEIQALYENHYLLLGVHEDRRKGNSNYEGQDRRNTNKRCLYGQFDNEIIETEEESLEDSMINEDSE